MAPLPHNSTPIYYLDYDTGDAEHTLEMRVKGDYSDADANTQLAALLAAADGSVKASTVLGLRFQAEGENFSVPVTWTGSTSFGTGAGDHQDEASFLSFVGRGVLGRRVRVTLFGYLGIDDRSSFRIARTASAIVDDMLDVIESNPDSFIDISGSTASYKPYANVGLNSYWQRKFR
jgi:hypothetical protein